jgi:hypothetical protein
MAPTTDLHDARAAPTLRTQHLDTAGDLAVAPDHPLLLELAEVVIDNRSAADAAALLDVANARGVVLVLDEGSKEIEDLVLFG